MKHSETIMLEQPAQGSVRRWFEAAGFLLAIDQPKNARSEKESNVVSGWHDALLLAEQGPLLQCIANWCQHDLNWQPLLTQPHTDIDITLESQTGVPRRVGLVVPQESKNTLPQWPNALHEFVKLTHHRAPLQICFDQFAVSGEDAAKCDAGAFVLLPNSFARQWLVQMIAADTSQPLSKTVAQSSACHVITHAQLDKLNAQLQYHANHNTPDASDTGKSTDTTSSMSEASLMVVSKKAYTVDMSSWQSDTPRQVDESKQSRASRRSRVSKPSSESKRRSASEDETAPMDSGAPVIELGALDSLGVLIIKRIGEQVSVFDATLCRIGEGYAAQLTAHIDE